MVAARVLSGTDGEGRRIALHLMRLTSSDDWRAADEWPILSMPHRIRTGRFGDLKRTSSHRLVATVTDDEEES
jgi:hypothetical protein